MAYEDDYQNYENVGDWAGGAGTIAGGVGGLAFGNPALGAAVGGTLGGMVGQWSKGQAAALARKRLAGLPSDPAVMARAGELYGVANQDISKAASGASEGAANSYARRGLAHSGMSAGAQGSIANQAGAARAQAHLGANSQALGEGMQREAPLQQQAYQQYGQAQNYHQGYLKDLESIIGYKDPSTRGLVAGRNGMNPFAGAGAPNGAESDTGIMSPQMIPDEEPADSWMTANDPGLLALLNRKRGY